jgi:arylsulfatase A-like enzyme
MLWDSLKSKYKRMKIVRALFPVFFVLIACTNNKPLPNIVLVITDDQGYGDLSVHGSPDVYTPNLDKLHEQSIRFTDFQASPTCSPTRSALETGRSPFKNGITHTIYERERMTVDAFTLPQMLHEAGYVSGIFGKWHLGDEDQHQPENRGYDRVFIHGAGGIGQKYPCSCADAPGNTYFNPVIKDQSIFVKTEGFCTDIFFNEAMKFIWKNGEKEQAFFARISTNAPHAPFVAPDEYTKKFADQGYGGSAQGFYGMIENIDDNMGLLMENLEKWGLAENTILIFMSDNGKALHSDQGKAYGANQPAYNAGLRGYKGTVHEGGTKVPFFVRWPDKWDGGRDIETLASHFDIYPTLADIIGIDLPAPTQVEGRSLLPLLNDGDAEWSDRYRVFHQGRWPVGDEPNDYQFKNFAIRNERFRLVGIDQLYDIQADPGEKTNVIEQHPEVLKAMMAYYDQWWSEARPLMVNEGAVMSKIWPFHEKYYAQEKNGGIPDWVK